MPLRDTTEPTLLGRGDEYVVFIASGTPPWCSDCRDALPVLEKVFTNEADDTILQVVKVGTEEEWKSPDNTWKGGPYRIEEIPCLIKYEDVSLLRYAMLRNSSIHTFSIAVS